MTVIGSCKGNYRVDPGDLVCIWRDSNVEGQFDDAYLVNEWYVDDCKQGTTACRYLVRPSDVGHYITCVQTYVDKASGDRVPLPKSNMLPVGRFIRKNRPICRVCRTAR